MRKAILIDTSVCIGCKACQAACKQWNDLPAVSSRNTGTYQNPPKLSARTWTTVKFIEHVDRGRPQWLFLPLRCMHCREAPCVWVCPSGAMQQVHGHYAVVNSEWCIGCRYCVLACPYGAPHLEPQTGCVRKCTFCVDRLGNDLPPACVKACPSGAISFGEREELLARAKTALERRRPAYPNANLYGETQLGGLNVLYLLLHAPAVYGLPERPTRPAEKLAINWASSAVAAGLLATVPLWWVIKRRMDFQEGEPSSPLPQETGKKESSRPDEAGRHDA